MPNTRAPLSFVTVATDVSTTRKAVAAYQAVVAQSPRGLTQVAARCVAKIIDWQAIHNPLRQRYFRIMSTLFTRDQLHALLLSRLRAFSKAHGLPRSKAAFAGADECDPDSFIDLLECVFEIWSESKISSSLDAIETWKEKNDDWADSLDQTFFEWLYQLDNPTSEAPEDGPVCI